MLKGSRPPPHLSMFLGIKKSLSFFWKDPSLDVLEAFRLESGSIMASTTGSASAVFVETTGDTEELCSSFLTGKKTHKYSVNIFNFKTNT